MTLGSETSSASYAGDGTTSVFSTGFAFVKNADVRVVLRSAAGVETLWTLGTEYTLSGAGTGAAGSVTAVTTPTDYRPQSGEQLHIFRKPAEKQETALPSGGAFPSSSVEAMSDLLTMLLQRHSDEIARAPLLAETSPTSGLVIPEPTADNILAWNAGATNFTNITLNSLALSGLDTLTGSEADDDILSYLSGKWRNRTPLALNLARLNAANTLTDINTFNAQVRWAKGADLASAATLVLGTDGNFFDISGTTGITAITVVAGTLFMLQFDGALTLTHHATNLNLPGGANITTAAGDRLLGFATGTNTVHVLAYVRADGRPVTQSGNIVQIVHASDGAVATGTTVMVNDDTIPQNTEGDEYITATITPGATANRLIIEVQIHVANSAAVNVMAGLFQDSTADALASTVDRGVAVDTVHILTIRHEMAAGTTSATTFKIRAGGTGAGTTTFNGAAAARLHGGVMTSSITIYEKAA